MDEHDRTADQGEQEVGGVGPADQNPGGEGVPVPPRIRDSVDAIRRRAAEEAARGRDVVREYEERYYRSRAERRSRLETSTEAEEADPSPARVPMSVKAKRQSAPDDNERKWAALAHASTLLTALVGVASGGAGVLLTMFVPLCIYFAFRKRSEYVAFHALQALTIQLVGTIGWASLVFLGILATIALFLLSLVLILVAVGIILAPLTIVGGILFLLASFALPIGMVVYSMIAAVETWNGNDYRYPYIARWVETQMHGGTL